MPASCLYLTSLAPVSPGKAPGVQQAAVQSWLRHQARVVSANAPEEIAVLADSFPGVEFVPLERTAAARAGKPVPMIDDLLHLGASLSPQRPFLLLNSDIVLAGNQAAMQVLEQAAAAGALVCGARHDVDDAGRARQAVESGQAIDSTVAGGYDYFMIPPTLPARLARTDLALGMAFWDYWLPLASHLLGLPLHHVAAPLALHSRHDSNWESGKFAFFHSFLQAILRHFGQRQESLDAGERLLWEMLSFEHGSLVERVRQLPADSPDGPKAMEALADFYDRQQAVMVHHIRHHAIPLEIPPPDLPPPDLPLPGQPPLACPS